MAKFHGLLPRRGPLPFRYLLLLSFVFFILLTTLGLWLINRGLEPTLVSVAETETKRIATLVINNAVNKQVEEGKNTGKIISVEKDKDGKITSVNLDTHLINSMQAKITNRVQQELQEAEKGNVELLELPDEEFEASGPDEDGIIYYIPLGQATNNALLGNLGPRIPVRFYVVGNVISDVTNTIEEYGINNAAIRVSIHIKVNVQVVVPFETQMATVENTIPVVNRIIPGDVPNFFNGGGDSSPSIEIPSGD
ncbi:sporulation protein YunB [Metabacillus arenae]|uniref:sporulation protein YunB n=1 Tax=Metabacillus arenae TaxID=2771434 RepID=UPI001CD074BA|nr:sporulation protein YunB [Metabacillus arenae]